MIITTASTIDRGATGLQWRIDLSKIPGIRDVFNSGQDYDFEFFFDPHSLSDKVTIRYIETQNLLVEDVPVGPQTVRTTNELVPRIRSKSSIFCDFDEERSNITSAFPAVSPHTQWINVHDGKELIISDLIGLELSGTRILADPRYAWVLNFNRCNDIALRRFTIGHTKAGYCMGGVLRFQDCANITIERCDLFGSGTYGLELVDCENVEIVGTTVRECTFGAVRLTNVSNAAFRDCEFKKNEGFELFEFDGRLDGVTLQDCRIFENRIEGAILCFANRNGSGVFVHNSSCTNNQCAEITSPSNFLGSFDHESGNQIVPTFWASNRG